VPGGAAARVADLVDETANVIERFDVLGVFPESKLAVALLDDGVDPAQPILLTVDRPL
jgi:hypothetical protein